MTVFQDAGLNVEWTPQVPGASEAMGAVLTGQSDITIIAATGAVAAAGAGRPARIMSGETMEGWISPPVFGGLAVLPSVAKQLAATGVTPASPWRDKVRALKGLRLFAGASGGTLELRYRQLFSAVGLDPVNDVTLVAGDNNTGNVAWRTGQVDAFSCCEPNTFQVRPDAVVWVQPGEVDLPTKGYHEILATTEQYALANPEVLRRVVEVQKRMTTMIAAAIPGSQERADILTAVDAQYPSVDPKLIAESFDTGRHYFAINNVLDPTILQDTIDDYNSAATPVEQVTITAKDLAAPGMMNN